MIKIITITNETYKRLEKFKQQNKGKDMDHTINQLLNNYEESDEEYNKLNRVDLK